MQTRLDLAHRLRQCMEQHGDTSATLAEVFAIRPQSVDSWLRTGRIAKSRLPGLARRYKRPISWWLGSEVADDDETMLTPEERQLIDDYRAVHDALKAAARASVRNLRDVEPQSPSPQDSKPKRPG